MKIIEIGVNCRICGANIERLTDEGRTKCKSYGLSEASIYDFETICLRCIG